MSTLEYVRMIISDTDPMNYLFTDEQLLVLIEKNLVYQQCELEQVAQRKFKIKTQYLPLNDVEYVIFSEDGSTVLSSDYVIRPFKRLVEFYYDIEGGLYIEGDFFDEDNFKADVFEAIASDFRKLQNYAMQNVNGNLSDAKEHLFRMARYFRTPR